MSADATIEHTIIQASAGSGKTFQLANRYLKLIAAGSAPENLLASTFTRKAAGEILDRIVGRLAEAAISEPKRAELAKHLQIDSLNAEKCLALVSRLTRNLYRLRVSTLDAFFAQIAGAFSLELKLPPGWQIVDEMTDERLRTRAIGAVLRNNDTEDLMQLTYALSQGEASRGVAQLIRDTVDDLYSVFRRTDFAAWSLLPNLKSLQPDKVSELFQEIQTAELPADKRCEKARDADLVRIANEDWAGVVANGFGKLARQGKTTYYNKEIPAATFAAYERLVDHAKAILIGRLKRQTEGTYELLERFDREYVRLKQERQALRFEDITERIADSQVLSDRNRLSFRLDAPINHLLLDEFQDTSPEQWSILKPIAEPIIGENSEGAFFCVGDEKQAIYAWRGGVAEIFDDVKALLPDVEPTPLYESYRSSPRIMETTNAIFTNLKNHGDPGRGEEALNAWAERFIPHTTARKTLPGYATLETSRAHDKELGESLLDTCIAAAVDRVAALVTESPGFSIGVLVRGNATVGKMIHQLRSRNIAASEEGGNPLTDSSGVSVAMSALRLADHPGDKPARFHLLHSPLNELYPINDSKDDAGAFAASSKIRRELQETGYGPTIERWVERLRPLGNRREQRRLDQLIELAYAHQSHATLRASDFRRVLVNQRVADSAVADVRVMTVHQSKGLEFDIVVLPELKVQFVGQAPKYVVDRATPTAPIRGVVRHTRKDLQELLPDKIARMFTETEKRSVIESLCLLYVAVTRARFALHMVIPPDTKTTHKTLAGLLLATLAPEAKIQEEQLVWSHGEVDWAQSPDAAPDRTADDVEPTAARPPIKVTLAESETKRRRILGRTTPSSLEGGGTVRLAQLLDQSRQHVMQAGTLAHEWLQTIEWLEVGVPDDAALKQLAAQIGAGDIDCTAAISDFRQWIATPNVAKLLSPSYYAPGGEGNASSDAYELTVEVERPFAVRRDDVIVEGSIDRLVIFKHQGKVVGADVIDFKTDRLASADQDAINARRTFYAPQLEAYRQAAATLLHLKPEQVTARLAFVRIDAIAQL